MADFPHPADANLRWQPPEEGVFKINTDVAEAGESTEGELEL